ncbi:hypothetical protein ACJZ2D_000257 [Fusarium nematophilum]
MASIGKICPSAISIPNELTVAAAAFNIDFSLLKIEAPKAFHGVRDALSVQRRDEAEGRQPHITARRLGALFEAKIPPVTNLIEAPGIVAGQMPAYLGRRQTQMGQTSGSGALAVHLLSCLLARIWKSHEAISLWVELAERRKQEILSNLKDGSPTELAGAMAAQQIITQDHLAAWDASARSWLHTADSAKRRQQTQLNLIINNVGIAVNSRHEPYESVMEAWVSAMKAMERLVQGVPQRVNDGAILLAISSWHLYPNMQVLLGETRAVDQNDKLMRGAVITISEQSSDPNPPRGGVFWSLPLSRMRFYNPPELRNAHVASDTSRVTMNEFWIVVLGAIVGPWIHYGLSIDEACEFINFLAKRVDATGTGAPVPWLAFMSKAATQYLTSSGLEQQQAMQLFGLGRRRCKHFFSPDNIKFPALFGLTNVAVLRSVVQRSRSSPGAGFKERIQVLHKIAQSLDCPNEDLIIRYLTEPPPHYETMYAYASALPASRGSSKKTHSSEANPPLSYTRWIVASTRFRFRFPPPGCDARDCQCVSSSSSECLCPITVGGCTESCHPRQSTCENFRPLISLACENQPKTDQDDQSSTRVEHIPDGLPAPHRTRADCAESKCRACYNRRVKEHVEGLGELCKFIIPDPSIADQSHFTLSTRDHAEPRTFEFLLGGLRSVALFKQKGADVRRRHSSPSSQGETDEDQILYYKAMQREVNEILLQPDFNPAELVKHLAKFFSSCSITGKSISALEFATTVYEGLDGATVNLEVLNLTLSEIRWVQAQEPSRKYYPREMPPVQSADGNLAPTLADIFACVAMFDSGYFDIDPLSLRGVFALSSGDSIYVASRLLDDPATEASSRSKSETRLVQPDILASGQPLSFDMQFQDSFTGTTLHLSFTDFEMPLDLGFRGLRDVPASLVESVITLDDKGKQLGDLDIAPVVFGGPYMLLNNKCQHGTEGASSAPSRGSALSRLASIDCWAELLDFPDQKGIFRATGNWQARIAGLAASMQLGKKVLMLAQMPCLECLSMSLADRTLLNEIDVVIT